MLPAPETESSKERLVLSWAEVAKIVFGVTPGEGGSEFETFLKADRINATKLERMKERKDA